VLSFSEKTVPCDKIILQSPSLLCSQDNNEASDTFFEVEFLKDKPSWRIFPPNC